MSMRILLFSSLFLAFSTKILPTITFDDGGEYTIDGNNGQSYEDIDVTNKSKLNLSNVTVKRLFATNSCAINCMNCSGVAWEIEDPYECNLTKVGLHYLFFNNQDAGAFYPTRNNESTKRDDEGIINDCDPEVVKGITIQPRSTHVVNGTRIYTSNPAIQINQCHIPHIDVHNPRGLVETLGITANAMSRMQIVSPVGITRVNTWGNTNVIDTNTPNMITAVGKSKIQDISQYTKEG